MTHGRTPRKVSVLFLTSFFSPPVYWTIVPRLYDLSPQWTRIGISFLVEFDLDQWKGQLLLQCWFCPQVGTVRNWFPMERKKNVKLFSESLTLSYHVLVSIWQIINFNWVWNTAHNKGYMIYRCYWDDLQWLKVISGLTLCTNVQKKKELTNF